MQNIMEKITRFKPAFHNVDDDPTKNYGVGSVMCYMVLKGELGAVHFIFSTGMFLDETYEYWKRKGLHTETNRPDFMGYDVGYHSPKKLSDWQVGGRKDCEWIGKQCFCDGSIMRAEEWLKIFLEKGSDEIWKLLEEEYKEIFGSLK